MTLLFIILSLVSGEKMFEVLNVKYPDIIQRIEHLCIVPINIRIVILITMHCYVRMFGYTDYRSSSNRHIAT